jgi:hypothetical protein
MEMYLNRNLKPAICNLGPPLALTALGRVATLSRISPTPRHGNMRPAKIAPSLAGNPDADAEINDPFLAQN